MFVQLCTPGSGKDHFRRTRAPRGHPPALCDTPAGWPMRADSAALGLH